MAYPQGTYPYPVQDKKGAPPPVAQPPHPYQANPGGYPAYYPQGSYPMGATAMAPQPQGGPPPPYTPYNGQNPGYYQQPMTYVQPMSSGSYDAGARFGNGSTANVPPPPPGVMPNAAQVAASQGRPVAMTQRPSDWVAGGSGGGYTFW